VFKTLAMMSQKHPLNLYAFN